MGDDCFREQVTAYVLGVLEGPERDELARHLAECAGCRTAVATEEPLVARLASLLPATLPPPSLKEQILDLAEAPRGRIDRACYTWLELVPGLKACVLDEDPVRGVRAVLVLGQKGAKHPRHRHHGQENILVLEGSIRDDRGVYGPGEIVRSQTGSVHAEEAVEDCLCYVVYYGELEFVEA